MAFDPNNPYTWQQAGPGVDPAIQQEMQAWAMGDGQGSSPFWSPQDLNAYPYMQGPEDPDELNSLGYQNDRLTALKKGLDVSADPAWLANQGATLGGYPESAYGYETQYQPIQANGYLRAQQLVNSTDPLTAFIAGRALQGADTMSIRNEIARIRNGDLQPGEEDLAPLSEHFQKSIGNRINQYGEEVPNLLDQALDSTIAGIVDPLAADDPRWDRQTRDAQGMPALAYDAPTEAQQALERQGYTHNPYETFDPWMFAPEGDTPQGLEDLRMKGRIALEDSRRATSEAGAANRAMSRYMIGDTPQKAVRSAWGNIRDKVAPAERASLGVRLTPQEEGGDGKTFEAMSTYLTPDHLRPGGERSQQIGRERARAASTAANLANMQAMERSQRQYGLMSQANWRNEDRQRYANDLAAMGITPYELQRQAKQTNIWGL